MLGLLLIACVLLQTSNAKGPDEPFYLVTISSIAVGGSYETLCVLMNPRINATTEASYVKVTLKMLGKSTTILEANSNYYGCAPFQVPIVAVDTVATICTVVRWGENKALSKKTEILIKPSSFLYIIQTDKPIYKPGQIIKFRIVSLDTSFFPHNEVYRTVALMDPQSNRIGQWLNQTAINGILDLSFPTTLEAEPGVYKITTWNRMSQESFQTFEIREYVLPKFEVTVQLPDVISTLDNEVEVKICGKYTYGKRVQGSVRTKVCIAPAAFLRGPFPIPPGPSVCMMYEMKTDLFGCAAKNIDISTFNLTLLDYGGHFIVESAMEEDGTGVILKGNGRVEITTTIFSIEFEDVSSTFRQKIDFTGKIILKGAEPFLLAGKLINLRMQYGSTIKNWILTSDIEGVANFSLDTSEVDTNYISIEARYVDEWNDDGIEPHAADDRNPKYMTGFHTAYAFHSKSKSFLQIKQDKGPISCDKDFWVQANFIIHKDESGLCETKKFLDFFFLVASKGGIVHHGHLPVRLFDEDGTPSGEQSNFGVMRGELSFPLQQGCQAPYAQVVVYTVLPNGEVVADSFDFPIKLFFKNKVSLQFSSSQELPGEKTFLKVRAQPGSLCSLRAIDQSVLLMRPDKELDVEKVYNKLPVPNMNGYPYRVVDPEPPCTRKMITPPTEGRRRKRSLLPYFYYTFDAKRMFEAVGIKVVTNLYMQKPRPCYGGVPPPRPVPFIPAERDTDTKTAKEIFRTFFPETWIWELVSVGESGRLTVERTIPDTITTWTASGFCTSPTGFGLATSTSLTAFQPFFVSLTLPYSIIRKEVFPLKATVFNYLSKCIMVGVTLKDSAQFTVQQLGGVSYRRCLCGDESETFTWTLTATTLGRVVITVSAEALSTEELCGNEVVFVPERGQIDTVVRTLLVEPEGTEQTVSHNIMLCRQGGSMEENIDLRLPEVFVEGSAKASISVLGDLMGRATRNLDSLLAMPYGCGEQNMLLFAPNIYILRYLETTGQLTPEIKSKAITYLEKGYQRELKYRHSDGSYSAFGQKRDPSGNTWLTAFVMKSFGGATRYIYIDPKYITSAKVWLSLQQQEDGCMESVGKLFNNGMKGGVSDEVMLTAYVTAALLELGTDINDPMVQMSLACLRQASDQIKSTYATALLSYTFTLAGDHVMRMRLIEHLDRVSIVTEQGRHWEHAGASGSGSLAVETTSYVLLALLSGPLLSHVPLNLGLDYSTSIVRWLAHQQNPYGGFSSTQDTVVALQALTLYAAVTFSKGGATTVMVTSTGGYRRQFRVHEHNRLLYQEEQLQEVPGVYNIKANGEACAFVQITLQYNILPPPDFSSFIISANATGVCNSANKRSLTVFVDARYNGHCSNMVIIDIRILSGFIVNEGSLMQLKDHRSVRRVDQNKNHVIIYLNEMKKMRPLLFSLKINEDIQIRNLMSAVVHIYDYYNNHDKAVTAYTSPCTSQVINEPMDSMVCEVGP